MENQLTKREVVALEFAKIFFEKTIIINTVLHIEEAVGKVASLDIDSVLTETLIIKSFDFADLFIDQSEDSQPNG